MAQPPNLRVGLLINGLQLPAWARYVIQELADCDFTVPAVVVLDSQRGLERKRSRYNRIGRFLWALYLWVDRRFSAPGPPAFETGDATPLLRGLPRQSCAEADSRMTAEVLRSHDLDVLLSLSSGAVHEDWLGEAKHGVWTLDPARPATPSEAPGGFWDAVEGRPVTLCELRMLNANGGRVIARSFLATDAWSISRNQNRYYWRGATLIVRKLRELQRLGEALAFQVPQSPGLSHAGPRQSAQSRPRLPLLRQGTRLVRFLSRHLLFRNQWALLYCFADEAPAGLENYTLLRSSRDKFWADPFVVQNRGEYFIFVEEYVYSKERGHISVIETDQAGRFGQAVTLIDEPYHLSYPFVFQWQGSYYLIPESGDNNSIEVYHCVDFPYKWEKHKTLMKGQPFADTTLLHHDNRWWLFVNIADHPGASTWDELFVFHADSPVSDHWTPHAKNPVVSDAAKARPAGCIFRCDGMLYRPSQDCSRGYGYGLTIHRIDKLTPLEYGETAVTSIVPSGRRGIRGVHTFNQAGQLWMMDAKLRRLRGF